MDGGLKASQLLAWHNFYPRRETGLADLFFHSQNELFKRLGIPVCAYIPGDGEKRGPLFEGLPTLEQHREMDPFLSALELSITGVEDIYIGDPEVSEELLGRLIDFDRDHRVSIANQRLSRRRVSAPSDFSRDVLRLMDTRSSNQLPLKIRYHGNWIHYNG